MTRGNPRGPFPVLPIMTQQDAHAHAHDGDGGGAVDEDDTRQPT